METIKDFAETDYRTHVCRTCDHRAYAGAWMVCANRSGPMYNRAINLMADSCEGHTNRESRT